MTIRTGFTILAIAFFIAVLAMGFGTQSMIGPARAQVAGAPVAHAGFDRTVSQDDIVVLDGTRTHDPVPDGAKLVLSWSFVSVPATSTAALSSPIHMKPIFTADQPGDYVIQLVATDDAGNSSLADIVTISTNNSAPVARAGRDRAIPSPLFPQTVELNGSGSWDVDGDTLNFAWTLVSVPATSTAAISDPNAMRPTFDANIDGDYVAELTVSDGVRTSDAATVTVTVGAGNVAPVADAGDDLYTGLSIVPDGYRSSDANDDTLSYSWAFVWGAGGMVDGVGRRANFSCPNGGGICVVQLITNDGVASSQPATMTILAGGNVPPVANAGPDQAIAAGATVQLDATDSHDINGGPIRFRWALTSQPTGSTAAISNPLAVRPTFTADLPGTYVAQLIAGDNTEQGAPDTVVISTGNLAPVADAGPDQLPGTSAIQLNGSGSTDANGDVLIYRWSLVERPARSAAALSDPGAANPTFTADKTGIYMAQLYVSDGVSESGPDTVIVSTARFSVDSNIRPVANAGPDQSAVAPNSTVQLNASGSIDLDAGAIQYYAWKLIVKPEGSGAAISAPAASSPTFLADTGGIYVAQLIIKDVSIFSEPDTVVISTLNRAPTANAGLDQSVLIGETVALNGVGSNDPDGDPLNYSWTLTGKPAGSGASLSGGITATPSFVPDYDGDYTFSLTVNDGEFASAADSVTVTAANQPPVLGAVGPQTVDLGSALTIQLTATDPNPGTALAFSAAPLPLPANASLDATTGLFTFRPDETQAGAYSLTFGVTDGLLTDSEIVSITVNAAPVGGTTAISGRVLDTNVFIVDGTELGVQGATISVIDAPTITTVTDINGNFTLSGIPAGLQTLDIDSSTALDSPDPLNPDYAGFREELTIIAAVTNNIDRPLYLPRIEADSLGYVSATSNRTITNSRLGVSLAVNADTAENPDGSPYTGQLSISEVPLALAPAALPDTLKPGLLVTIQPVGVTFWSPAKITFPNIDNLPPGKQIDLWSLDASSGAFAIVGTLQVSTDGTKLTTISGGIRATDWHFPMPGGSGLDGDNDSDCKGSSPVPSGSSTSLCSGDLSVAHDLVGYQSAGQDRSLRLVYNSTAADPRPIIRLKASMPPTLSKPQTTSMSLSFGGVIQGPSLVTDTSGLNQAANETIVQAYQFDARSLPTGLHRYLASVSNNYSSSAIGNRFSGIVSVNNERDSVFGAGWTLQGLQRIAEGEEGLVVSDTGGSLARMAPPNFTGNGAFAPANNFGAITDPSAFAIDDIDGDGNADLIVPDNATGEFHVMFGDGQGGFPRTERIDADPWAPAGPDKAIAVATGALDQDDPDDVVVLDRAGGSNYLHFGIGDNGNFVTPPDWEGSAGTPNSLALADFNLDGKDDRASTGNTGCTLLIRILGSTCYSNIAFNSIIAVDLNGDNIADIAATEPANGRVRVFLSDGAGQFGTVAYPAGAVSGIPARWELATADFDRNDAIDIVVVNRDAGTVSILPGNGAGGFGARTAFSAGTTPASLVVADFNSDSYADVVVVSDTTGEISLLYGDGNGGLSAPETFTLSAGASLTSMRVADFNNDNVADLAIANGTDGAISVLLGLPSDTIVMTGRGGDYSNLQYNANGTYTRTFRNGKTIEFNTLGLQTSVRDIAGRTTGFTYDTSDRIWKVTDEAGLVTTFAYDAAGKLESITDPAGRVTRFTHDPRGDLIEIVDPDDSVRRFAYDFDHRMQSQTSKRGFVTQYEYNSYGRHIRSVWPDFSERHVVSARTFGLPDRSSSGSAPFVRSTTVAGSFTNGNDHTETRQLNRFGVTTSITDALGRTATIQRDSNNNPEKITLPGRDVTLTYYDNGLIHTLTTTDTATHTVPYSTNGESRTRTYTYNAQNKLETIDGPRTDVSDVLRLEYDPVTGDTTRITNALGQTIQITARNAYGQPLTMVDQNNVQTGFTYFPEGWLQTLTTDQLGVPATTSFTNDTAGQIKTMTTPGGATLTYEYDLMGRVKAIQNDDGERIENTYDGAGNLKQTDVRAAGAPGTIVRTSSAVFDELDRLLKAVGAYAGEETLFAYDANGNVERITDPRGNDTTIAHDAVDRVKAVTDALLNQSSNTYDEAGNLETVTDQRNLVTSHVYNGFGQIIQLTSPDTGIAKFWYDSAGNLAKRSDARGVAAEFTYDAGHRLTGMTFADTPAEDVTYAYDDATPGHYGIGRLASVTDESGSTTYRYDSRGNIVRVDRVIGTQTYVSEYAWNSDSLLVQKTFPSGRIVTYIRDIQGRVTEVRTRETAVAPEVTLASAIGYEPFGPINAMTYGNNVTAAYQYDLDGRLLAMDSAKDATSILTLNYDYDLAGNIIGIADAGNGDNGRNFTYDPLNRLTRGELLDGTGAVAEALDYNYDAAGNRIERRIDGVAETYSYDPTSSRLASVLAGGVTRAFTYNAIGNVTLDDRGGSATTLTYNSTGRLVQVSAGAIPLVDYVYAADGQRAVKATPTATTHYLYEPGGALYAETDGAGTVLREYVTLGGVTLAVIDSGGTSYVHSDHIGTGQTMTDGTTGAVVWDASYRPFGEVTVTAGAAALNQRFPGQYADAETGYSDNWNRTYDPSLGRYLQSDPIGLAGGLNTYGYVDGNPVMYIDPEGLAASLGGAAMKCLKEVLGIETIIAVGLVAVGQPIPGTKRFRTEGSSRGTSVAGITAKKVFGDRKLPGKKGWPTIVGGPGTGRKLAISHTRNIGRFAGRAVPIVGWGLLILDLGQFGGCMYECTKT